MKWIDRYRKAAESAAGMINRTGQNGDTTGFAAKATADDPEYANRVAKPVMQAIDEMPEVWRGLVHQYGYVDVYRAWRRGIPASVVAQRAAANGGFFVL